MTKTIEIIRRGIDEGLHLGAQIFVWHGGNTVFDEGIGEAAVGVPMTRDTVNLWWSSCKPLAGVAIGQLRERGKLDWDDPVAKHIPEFAVHEKDRITIRQCLTHTAGFRQWPPGLELSAPWEQIIAKICASRTEPRWPPGEKAGYHGRTAWFVLAEIVRRLDGRSYDQFVREEIFKPLVMYDSWMCLPAAVFEKYSHDHRLGAMMDTAKDPPDRFDPKHGLPTKIEAALLHPGGSGRGPMRDLARFYWMMLSMGDLEGTQIIQADTADDLVAPHRVGLYDYTFKHVMDWGLGFILNTHRKDVESMPYGYGRFASPKTYGHSGSQSSCAFCDPEHRLIVAWVCNGMPGEEKHQQRQREINDGIYLDLKIGTV